MASDSWVYVGVYTWCCVVVFAYCIAVIWSFLRGSYKDCTPAAMAQMLRNYSFSILGGEQPRVEGMDRIEAASRVLLRCRHVEFVKRGIFVVAPVLTPVLVLAVFSQVEAVDLRGGFHVDDGYAIISSLAPALAALCIYSREQPHNDIMVATQFTAFSGLALVCSRYHNGSQLLFDRSTSFLFRLGLCMMLLDVRLTALLNVFYSAYVCYRFQSFAQSEQNIASLGVHCFVFQEVAVVVSLTLLPLLIQSYMETAARTTTEAKASRSLVDALLQLLKLNYDAVVELNHDLIVADDSQDLANMLMHPAFHSLKGTVFAEHIAHDVDKVFFNRHVTRPQTGVESQCHAIPYRFRMRDSDSNPLLVEMWHSRFEDLDKQARHLIGVKQVIGDNPHPIESRTRTRRTANVLEQQVIGRCSQEARPGPGNEHPDGPSNSASAPTTLFVEGLEPTSVIARKTSLLHTLTGWNIVLRPRACCSYHQVIKEASRSLKALNASTCNPFHLLCGKWQCAGCGILASGAAEAGYDASLKTCYVCKDTLPAPSPTAVRI